MSPRVCLIANPAAGRGQAGRVLPILREALATYGVSDVRVTRAPGDERRLACIAATEGVDTIIALGGDGTWGNVARGILDSNRDARLALAAGGTGNDLAFNASLPAHDPVAVVQIATGYAERRIDIGKVNDVAFLNVAGFGFETDVLAAIHRSALHGPAVYYVTAARRLFGYRGIAARLHSDRDRTTKGLGPERYLAIVISNGRRFGGGFLIAPSAELDDGQLDATVVRDASPLRRAALFAKATRGWHIGAREVESFQTSGVTITFDDPPVFDADGELVQSASRELVITCEPKRLRLAGG